MSGTASDTFKRLNDTVYLIPAFLQSFNCILNHYIWHSVVLLEKVYHEPISARSANRGTTVANEFDSGTVDLPLAWSA
jgi:hypothetical protein